MKLVLGIEYNGSAYYGWQRQKKVHNVQTCLERAISNVANELVTVYCAGRTDTGVHATGQVVHFETKVCRSDAAWTFGVNANLPDDIAVRWVTQVADNFHARFSATSRRYRYIIYNYRLRTALLARRITCYYHHLDAPSMARAGQFLIGEHDFTSFSTKECQSRSSWRNVHHLYVNRYGQYIIFDIKANAFLHHMVRNIVGSLLEVGCGKKHESWISELITCRDKTQAGATSKAEGLYLIEVDYPSHFNLPKSSDGPLFF
ncbi:tRNA pseudouridine synthase A [secondary endosymbiont of Trabutina mannipara]|uniref:tRNA pseudouridine synthase A n=1 Tax=secondary endosymbiont of Trabutina mannipara TaxID=1835721 RepID=A0A1C3L425_9ENTR|nr:tRNA pseudouridine(38-40) synthase TruA [secondary endosymbiont of Trabutina mannipara]SBT82021.1 tRNA pseudouridine synthase A [secondary endosymbiont of Trabutina mannipara]